MHLRNVPLAARLGGKYSAWCEEVITCSEEIDKGSNIPSSGIGRKRTEDPMESGI